MLIFFLQSSASDQDQGKSSNEFDFLINCVWSSVVGCFDFNLNVIFSPADPDLFHEHFTKTFDFLNKFESKCSQFDKEFKRRLGDSQSYKYFVKKWPIQVYFQIRFQEIVAKFEEDLQNYTSTTTKNTNNEIDNTEDSEQADANPNHFYLAISETLIRQMEYCWVESKCFLKCLLSQFWKLNLQLVSRYANFFVHLFQNYAASIGNAADAQQTQLSSTTQIGEQLQRSKTPIENDLDSAQSVVKKSPLEDLNFCVLLLNDVNKLSTLKVA